MPDIWIDVDTAVTVPVNLLPLIDDTDFKTIETAIAYNAAGMDLRWNFITSAGVITSTAVTPTTSGTYDWTHVGDGIYKIEIPASGGASIDNDTEGYGWFSGVVTGVLPFRGPVIGFRASGLNDLLCDSAYSATRGLTGTAIPAAAADAAGGLPISDTGGLDLDTTDSNISAILTDTGTTLDGKINTIDSNVDAILVDTGTTLDGKLNTIDSNVDAILVDTGTTLPATLTTIEGKVDTVDGIVDTILVDTNELQTNQGNWVTAVDFATAANLATVDGIVDAILVDTGTTLPATLTTIEGKVDTVDGIVDTILVDTNELQTNQGNWVTAVDFATAANLATVDGIVDAILVDTGTTLPATLATIEGKVDTVDGIVDTILVDTGTTLDGKIDTIDGIVDAILIDTGTTLPATLATIDGIVDNILVDTGTTLPATLTTIEGKIDTVDGIVDNILVDTGTTLPATLTTIDGIVDDILVDTGTTLPTTLALIPQSGGTTSWNATALAAINTQCDTAISDASLATAANLATVDGIVDAILVDTGTTLPATLTTIEGKIDTVDGIVDNILVDTGTTLDGKIDTIDGIVDDILVDTGTTLPATLTTIDGIVDDILVDTGTTLPATLALIPQSGGTTSWNATALAAINAQCDTALSDWGKTGFSLTADQSAVTIGTVNTVNALSSAAITDIWSTDTLTESYAADGAAATPAQLLYMMYGSVAEFAISGTTVTVKKIDGSTAAMTFTLDDDTSPTSRTRAS